MIAQWPASELRPAAVRGRQLPVSGPLASATLAPGGLTPPLAAGSWCRIAPSAAATLWWPARLSGTGRTCSPSSATQQVCQVILRHHQRVRRRLPPPPPPNDPVRLPQLRAAHQRLHSACVEARRDRAPGPRAPRSWHDVLDRRPGVRLPAPQPLPLRRQVVELAAACGARAPRSTCPCPGCPEGSRCTALKRWPAYRSLSPVAIDRRAGRTRSDLSCRKNGC